MAPWRESSVLSQLPDTSAVATGLAAAIFASAFSEINLILLGLWGIAVVGDLVAGLWRVVVLEGWGEVSGSRFAAGMAKKVAFSFFWLAAALVDALSAVAPAIGPAISEVTVTTKAVLVALIVYEISSITRNAKQATGAAVPAALIMRTIDRLEVEEADEPR